MTAATKRIRVSESTSDARRAWAGADSVLWALLALYAAARFSQLLFDRLPMVAIVAVHVIPLTIFALVHGARLYRWSGIVGFVTLSLVVGNIFENIGVRTGFPYGHYYFTELMGPRLSVVPIFLGLAYVGMGYLSWTLARLILGGIRDPLTGSRVVTVPLVAALVMVAWDLSQDPVWGTILHLWIWRDGGAYFGVPVTNFLGWYLEGYVFYQLFALFVRQRANNPPIVPRAYWRLAVLCYGVSAAGNILLVIPGSGPSIVTDATGAQWRVSDITGACALVSILVMGAFAVLAWVRPGDRKARGEII
jgi:putative membrane protein